MTRFKI